MKDIDEAGVWWLPDDSENQLKGNLSFKVNDGFELTLFGAFDGKKGLQNFAPIPIILGITSSGKKITLVDCVGTNFSMGMGFETTKFVASQGFLGSLFTDSAELTFTGWQGTFSYLSDWIGGLIATFPIGYQENGKYDFSAEIPQDVEIDTEFGKIELRFSLSYTMSAFSDELKAKRKVSFFFDFLIAKSFQEIWSDFIFPLENFLMLATTKRNVVEELYVLSNNNLVALSGESRRDPIEVIFPQQFLEPKKQERLLIVNDMLFWMRDVSEDFPAILQRWLRIHGELDDVVHLLFATERNTRMYLNHQFLNISHGVETYHRRRKQNTDALILEHAKVLERIGGTVSPEDQDWLNRKLEYAYEPSLRKRLKELLEEREAVVSPIIKNTKKFIGSVVDTRNFLTHYDERLKGKIVEGSDLHLLFRQLSYVLKSCLLNEIGIDDEKQCEMFKRNSHFAHLISLAK